MISKIPKQRAELTVESLLSGGGNRFVLEYYLLESEIDDIEELRGVKAYGIEIVKNGEDGKVESAEARNISCSVSEASKFIEILSSNRVTPVTLNDVLEDMAGTLA